jgi:hypothetical protein
MGRGSPPWCLLSDRWSVSSNGLLLVACRRSAGFLQCSSVLRVADPIDRGLPTCKCSTLFGATPAVLLRCSEWHGTHKIYLFWDAAAPL